MSILSFILLFFLVAACAYWAEKMVPKTVPGDFIMPVVVGIIGASLGGSLTHHFGPDLAGISLIPCLLGSAGSVFVVSLLSLGLSRKASFRRLADEIDY